MKEYNDKILVIDNYDSFTFNLVYLLKELAPTATVDVYRNDEIEIEAIDEYDKILLSPGPSLPDDAGILKEVIRRYATTKSILGVCLGHQAIAEVFGAKLYNMEVVIHGEEAELQLDDEREVLFEHVANNSKIGLYHSWSVAPSSVPDHLKVIARNGDGNIMGIRHKEYDVVGLQFHPESILTACGRQIMSNWLYPENKP